MITDTTAHPARTAMAKTRYGAAGLTLAATLLPSGNVLIAGGSNSTGSLRQRGLYDPPSNSFAPPASAPTMNQARFDATATLLPNGKVLIAGGLGPSGSLDSVELYDPATNSFAPAVSLPAMNTPRDNATAVPLTNGKVLIAGGEKLRGGR